MSANPKITEGKPCPKCGSSRRYKNGGSCVDCLSRLGKAYRARVGPGAHRRRHLRREYGMTPEQVNAMFVAQGSACAICKTQNPEHKIKWHVDHCHVTGAVRGILCAPCNIGIGYLGDSADRLTAAARYLKNEKAEFVPSDWMLFA